MKRARVLVGGFLLALVGGISYAWGVFVIPMMNAYGWSKFQSTLPFTVFMAVFAVFMVPGGKLQDSWGPRKVSLIGAILFLAAYGLASLVRLIPSPWWLVFTYGLLGGAACGLSYACVAPPARKWYPDKPAFAVSMAVMGFGLAAVVFAPLKANLLIPRLGIEGTFILIAVVAGSVSALASGLMRDPPADWRPPDGGTRKTRADILDMSPGQVLRTGKFWMIWSMFILVVSGGFITLGLIPSYAQRVILLDAREASVAISTFAAVNGLCRPLAGVLADRFGITKVMTVTFVLQAMAFIVFEFLAVNLASLIFLVSILGWGYAVILALFPSLASTNFGTKHMGANYGLVFTAFGVGAAAPLIGAAVFDRTGSFAPVFLPAGILSAAGALLCLVLRKRYSMR